MSASNCRSTVGRLRRQSFAARLGEECYDITDEGREILGKVGKIPGTIQADPPTIEKEDRQMMMFTQPETRP